MFLKWPARPLSGLILLLLAGAPAGSAGAPPAERPWMNAALGAGERTQLLLAAMTQDEKLKLLFGYFSSDAPWKNFKRPAEGVPQAAGYVPGIARLGIPAQNQTDAGIGVASQPGADPRLRTALPANLCTAATWDTQLAEAGGRMIGSEARASGFNVMLAGGIDLARDPRNGRNFEYGGEDPWLAGNMVGAQIRGIQSNHLVSTIKHYAFNDQETNRNTLDVRIDERAARMSDLLAFEIAIEQGRPGAVMCAYNRFNQAYACENPWLLTQVLKSDWGFKGYVMSDWGGTHSTIPAALAGLDQDSGYPFDASPYFADALREAVENGHVPAARLDDMAGRVLWSMFTQGLFDDRVMAGGSAGEIDLAEHAKVSQSDAEGGMVLLKNDRQLLPLGAGVGSIAVIGSHADRGVLSGGGSSQVYAAGNFELPNPRGERRTMVYYASPPRDALAQRSRARIAYDEGTDIKAAVKLARHSDVVIVFAQQWDAEGWDGTLRLDGDQDALIAALARVNHHVVVVLETGAPVLMPWIGQVGAVLEAWYPGSSGGVAIARVLTGEVNPSGRLPLTFPRSEQQLPRPTLDGYPEKPHARITVDYDVEGAAVGYKWFDRRHLQPLFPFGFGLSYSRFGASGLIAQVRDNRLSVHFRTRNTGTHPGRDVAQLYVSAPGPQAGWEAPQRLVGFKKVDLEPGAGVDSDVNVDPRLLAAYDVAARHWVIAAGDYEVLLARDAATPVARTVVHLQRELLSTP